MHYFTDREYVLVVWFATSETFLLAYRLEMCGPPENDEYKFCCLFQLHSYPGVRSIPG
jgi:hypothetical protein